jgi:hypothetical protein
MTIEAPFCSIEDDGIERTHLLDDPMYVVLPQGHRLAASRASASTSSAPSRSSAGRAAAARTR